MTDRPDDDTPPRPRGFARLTPEQRRMLGSKGGKTAHERGTANKFTSDVASRAGKIPHERGTAHHWTSEQARDAGRKGGVAARTTRAERAKALRDSAAPPADGAADAREGERDDES